MMPEAFRLFGSKNWGVAWTIPYLSGVVASFLWSCHVIVGWYFAHRISPVEFLFWRWLIAAVFMLVLFWRGICLDIYILIKWAPQLFFLAVLGSLGSNGLGYLALHYTAPTNVAIIYSSMPVMVVLLQFAFYFKPIDAQSLFGIILSMLGVIIIYSKGDVFLSLEWYIVRAIFLRFYLIFHGQCIRCCSQN